MSADPLSIRQAWTRIPSPGSAETEFERFTGKRMERILQTVVAIGSVLTGAQALLAAVSGMEVVDAVHIAMLVVVFVPLTAMLACCVIGRGVRVASTAFAFLYVGALIAWPLVVASSDDASDQQPWIFFLVNVGVVAAMLAFALRMQYIWAIAVPLIYGAVRMMQGEFERDFWITTAFDVSFTIILGLVFSSGMADIEVGSFSASQLKVSGSIAFLTGAFAGIIELVAGLLVTLGWFTRPAAFVASGPMAVAYWMAHGSQNFFPVNNMGDAAILYCFVFLYFVFAGPGAFSVDGRSTHIEVTDDQRL